MAIVSLISLVSPSAALADSTATPGSVIPWDSSQCADLTFIGARGSGQGVQEGDIYGFGPDVSLAANSLRTRIMQSLPNITTKYVPVLYPATSSDQYTLSGINPYAALDGRHNSWVSYSDSVAQGTQLFINRVAGTVSTCSNTKIVTVGYSQGAQVVSDGSRLLLNDQLSKVATTWLIAKPVLKHGATRDYQVSNYISENSGDNFVPDRIGLVNAASAIGIGIRQDEAPYPDSFHRNIVEMCHSLDKVCGFDSVPEAGYVKEYIDAVNSLNTVHGYAYKDVGWMQMASNYLFFPVFLALVS